MAKVDVRRALLGAEVALVGIERALEQDDLGTVESWEVYRIDEYGWGLSVVVSSKRHGGALVKRRTPLVGTGMDPETSGVTFSSGFWEALLMTHSLDAAASPLSEPIELTWPHLRNE